MFSIALGTSFSQKSQTPKNITVTVIGDGGMEEGIVYETLNLASLHNLPILFICENNRYSVHTSMKERILAENSKRKLKLLILIIFISNLTIYRTYLITSIDQLKKLDQNLNQSLLNLKHLELLVMLVQKMMMKNFIIEMMI